MAKKFKMPKLGSRVKTLKRDIQQDMEQQLAVDIVTRMDKVVAPFSYATFTFVIEDESTDDAVVLKVLPKDEELDRASDPARGAVNSRVLFSVLNNGSNNQVFRAYPDDFENESSPNSLSTRSADYERDDIYVDSSRPGRHIDPRNWTSLVREEYTPTGISKAKKIVSTTIGKLFK